MAMDVASTMAYNSAVVRSNQNSVTALKLQQQQERAVVDLAAKGLEQAKATAPKPSGSKGQIIDITV